MWGLAMILFLIGVLVVIKQRKEHFMSPGAMDQLSSTRVYTMGEVRKNAEERQKEIEHDLVDLTGSA
jgi:hypothetical protein